MSTQINMQDVIRTVVEGRELTQDQAEAAMNTIMSGEATEAQIGALAIGLRMKGETTNEIVGFARAMRAHAVQVDIDSDNQPLLDTCGTGGDQSNTFNISTTATFVIAAAGVRIAKHGNRAASSRCGSADVLEALGVKIELTPREVDVCVETVGVGFMYAPAYHPAMRFVGPARKQMGVRTIFNMLGPLTNPAGASHQLIGVGIPQIAGQMAEVLQALGSRHAVLVHGEEGVDEVGVVGRTRVTDFRASTGEISTYEVAPEDFGLQRATLADIIGGDAEENKNITLSILNGEEGPRRTVTLLNAGAGIYAADAADSLEEGIRLAAEMIDSGKALAKLEQLVAYTQELSA
ncbi:MAG: anthranilate phosphoribosyltransferase [Thermomicrobiales bacterium]|nr:anthranilate phosphoribosyltransferase [Thermomicrobiales bacterium]MCO5217802.1 anthranilate phosphoribosyltransferase [Thermomicrobiales bacterium]MCO5223941.1 anthranilate phosphoribosyltransferase [Thermomicrobiales bacterium]MCO5227504.1 anthranilate phosphoribosyltransferase [Thermomicrobiales bacterium]